MTTTGCASTLLQHPRGWLGRLVTLSLLPLSLSSFPAPARASGVADLMPNINILETTLHSSNAYLKYNACGVAAAAMLIDYYQLDYRLPVTDTPATIDDAARYVREDDSGTRTDYLQADLVTAEATLDPTLPVTDSWRQTDSAHWLASLQADLDQRLPLIVFIPNGQNLGWGFNWGHYLVVSGYTAEGGVIYHDPWDGATHTKSRVDFARAWGTPRPANNPDHSWTFSYLEVLPSSVNLPTPTPITTPSPRPTTVPTPTAACQADWSRGLDGWSGTPDWKVSSGLLINDGTNGADLHTTPSLVSSCNLGGLPNYSLVARIQVIHQGFDPGFGFFVRYTPPDKGYILGVTDRYNAANPLSGVTCTTADSFYQPIRTADFVPGSGPQTYVVTLSGDHIRLIIDGHIYLDVTDSHITSGAVLALWDKDTQLTVSTLRVLSG